MYLILGSPDDVLADEVCRRLSAKGAPVCRRDEADLFGATPFALELDRRGRRGFLHGGRHGRVALGDVSGALVRLPRLWWPAPDYDRQDQHFVFHETLAAWFCILAGLECPVVNRFGLGWWVGDLSVPLEMRGRLADRLGLEVDDAAEPAPLSRLLPTPAPDETDGGSLYVAGERVFPRTPRAAPLAARLPPEALACWRRESGIEFCRLDLAGGPPPRLRAVEPFPRLEGEPEALAGQIADAVVEALA